MYSCLGLIELECVRGFIEAAKFNDVREEDRY
jgi:hypothetical protein